jgi:hypothetical protein
MNVRRLVEEISGRPAAIRAKALTTKHAFKRDIDDEAGATCFVTQPSRKHLNAACFNRVGRNCIEVERVNARALFRDSARRR